MAKKSLLLVDADPRSLRVLEVSLRKAGYSVATCRDAGAALETVELSAPDLILSDTRLPGMNGFELVEELRRVDEHRDVPFMFLSSDSSVESKVRGLELGVEDYLTKPIYIKEIVTRINLSLQRREREGLAGRTSISKTRFTGLLEDMGLVDLLQTIDISRKSGVLELRNEDHRGTVTFKDGQLVDAELGHLIGAAAIYRLLLWSDGEFEIDFRPVRVEQRIRGSTQAILMEGMRRIDEWGRLLEQIPSLDNVFEVSEKELLERLAEIPDEINHILRHIDGSHSLIQVVDAAAGDDLETLTAITKLYFEGIIYPTGRTADEVVDAGLLVGEATVAELDPDLDSVPPPAEPEDPDHTSTEMVPRAPTVQPPSDRAIANTIEAPADTHVPVRAGVQVPTPGEIWDGTADPGDGMDAALEARASAPEPDPALNDSFFGSSADDGGSTPGENDPLSEDEAEDEDGMARKGRRRRRRGQAAQAAQKEAAQEQAAQEEKRQETANNVIQFPAQARGGVTQVAVNAVVGSVDEPVPEAEPPRDDQTQTLKRAEASAPEEAKAEPPAPEEAKAEPPEEAKAEPPEEAKAEPPEEAKAEPPEEAKVREPEPRPAVTEPARAPSEPKEPVAAPEAEVEEAAAEPAAAPEAEARPSRSPRQKKGKRRKRKKDGRRSKAPSASPPKAEAKAEGDDPLPTLDAAPGPDSKQRRKKIHTTSSAEIRAVTATGEYRVVAEDFFKKPKGTGNPAKQETWDDLEEAAIPISPAMKRAKYATFGILAGGLLLIGAFLLYNNVYMPPALDIGGNERTLDDHVPPPLPEDPEVDDPEDVTDPAPTVDTEDPVVDTEDPVVDTEDPVVDTEDPVVDTEDPVVDTEDPVVPPEGVDARQLARQALRALNRRRNEEAATLAQQAVTADQTNALGWVVLGAARGELGDAAGARQAYQSCVEHGTGRQVRDCRAMLR